MREGPTGWGGGPGGASPRRKPAPRDGPGRRAAAKRLCRGFWLTFRNSARGSRPYHPAPGGAPPGGPGNHNPSETRCLPSTSPD